MEVLEGLGIFVGIMLFLGFLTWRAGSAQLNRKIEPPIVHVHEYQSDHWRYTPDERRIVDAD